tara:strand:- start:1949 stop:2239 length:291 start_codon:yes stop_codon:yes gene_type:complete
METPVSLIPALMPCEKDCDVTNSEDFSCCDDNHCENTEITIVTGVDESENLSVEDYTRRYSLKQLREMCTKQNLSNVGNKKELAERIKNNVDDLNE